MSAECWCPMCAKGQDADCMKTDTLPPKTAHLFETVRAKAAEKPITVCRSCYGIGFMDRHVCWECQGVRSTT